MSTGDRASNGNALSVLIVGAGKMAQQHARAIMHCDREAKVAGVVDPDEHAREAMLELCPGAAAFTSVDEALAAAHFDVGHVCTPPESHAPIAEGLLGAGLHVYVEKPFTLTTESARSVLELAKSKGLEVCAGHQLLYEGPARGLFEVLPALGTLTHVESYFSFRNVREGVLGRPDYQLLDILPHPTYLLLELLAAGAPDGDIEIGDLHVGPGATLHALVRRGALTASLVVTLHGRPVESYLKVVGSNGTVEGDFVRGTVRRLIGPGASGIDKALNPYRTAWQGWWGTTGALMRRILKRGAAYPGLTELIGRFYAAIGEGSPGPVAPERILETVDICERVSVALSEISRPPQRDRDGPRILVTGGTGFLGKATVMALRESGAQVRVVARALPAPWDQLADVEYVECDTAEEIPSSVFDGVDVVIHCAAATRGSWPAHQRNSIDATKHMIRAAAAAQVKSFIHVSSMAVVVARGREQISERSPYPADPRQRGPYVWGKLESEKEAIALGKELGVQVRVVRPGAIVDYEGNYEPPGVLGRALGGLYVAVGSRREQVGMVQLGFAARFLANVALNPDGVPDLVNLLSPELPTKAELVRRLRQANPGLRVVWMPRFVLVPLSGLAVVAQKVLRPRTAAISVASVFAKRRYDTSVISGVAKSMEGAEPVDG